MHPRIKIKSELPSGKYTIPDQFTLSYKVKQSRLINSVYQLLVKNNKGKERLKSGGGTGGTVRGCSYKLLS